MKFGIDLGTTFSSIAYCEEDGEKLSVQEINLATNDNLQSTDSAVYFPPKGDPVVGSTALRRLVTDPERVIQWIKRDMGEDRVIELDGVKHTPSSVSAAILEVLAEDAAAWLGEDITGVVVCVPAWFGDRQREATRKAVELAGLPLIKLLSEPSSAVLAVSIERPEVLTPGDNQDYKDALVYDLGGGTFDVVLTRSRVGESGNLDVDTLCHDGHFKLGGHDWDLAFANFLAEKCMKESDDLDYHIEKSPDPRDWPHLLDSVEKGKKHFGKDPVQVFSVDMRGHSTEASLEEFNAATQHLLDRTEDFVKTVLEKGQKEHGVKIDELEVVLCGGASKLLAVTEMIKKLTGREPVKLKRSKPENLVVHGAAYAAHLSDSPESESAPTAPADVFRAVGVEVIVDGDDGEAVYENEVIIPDDTEAEKEFTKEFEIAEDDQTKLDILILQGSDTDATQCEHIGTVSISGLPEGRKEGSVVRVTLWYDSNGIIHGRAVDDETGEEGTIEIRR
jgi:molecular chaperone DnaK